MSDWTHLGDTKPVARKEHQCGLCLESIEPGTQYVRRAGVFDGSIHSFKMHIECDEYTRENWSPEEWETHEPGQVFLDEMEEAKRAGGQLRHSAGAPVEAPLPASEGAEQ